MVKKAGGKSKGKGQVLPIKELIADVNGGSSTSVVDPAGQSVALIPQPHGGALLPGGQIGNKGGPGRRPERIREKLQAILEEKLLPWIEITASQGETKTCPICGAVPNPKLLKELTKIALDAAVPKQQEVEVTGGVTLIHAP